MTVAGAKTYSTTRPDAQPASPLNNQTTTIAYDYESRITQIHLPDTSTNTFTYNALDTRVGKVDSGGTKTSRPRRGVTDDVLSDEPRLHAGISGEELGSTKFAHGDRLGTSPNAKLTPAKTTDCFQQYDARNATLLDRHKRQPVRVRRSLGLSRKDRDSA